MSEGLETVREALAVKGALGYRQAEKQVHRRRSDTKIHVRVQFYTHFPCQLVTMNYKG